MMKNKKKGSAPTPRVYRRTGILWIAAFTAAAVLLCASFAPKLLFAIQDRALFSEPKEITAVPGALDEKAAELYLVKAIHHLYEQGYKDHFSFLFNTTEYYNTMEEELVRQLQFLAQDGIISSDKLRQVLASKGELHPLISTDRKTTGGAYVEREMISVPYHEGTMRLQMEPKTGKLISITLGGASGASLYDETVTKRVMADYVAYLGLDVLDDWTYAKPYYVSQKAQLQIAAFNDTHMEVVPLNFLTAD